MSKMYNRDKLRIRAYNRDSTQALHDWHNVSNKFRTKKQPFRITQEDLEIQKKEFVSRSKDNHPITKGGN